MTLYLYTVVSNFAINFVHNLIGSCFLCFQYFFFLSRFLFLYSLLSDESESLDDEPDESYFLRFRCFFLLSRLLLYICCCCTNQIRLTMSLTNLGLTPDPLVRTLLALFLCVLKSPLLVFWGLVFSHQ